MEKMVGDVDFSNFFDAIQTTRRAGRNEPGLKVPEEALLGERNARRRFGRRIRRRWRTSRPRAIKDRGWFPIIIRENSQSDARHHEPGRAYSRGPREQIRRAAHAHEPAHTAATTAAANAKPTTFASLQQHRDD